MRETGILMPVFSLPSSTGAGDLGQAAYQWVNLLAKSHIGIWQILPLNPVGYGNSPYQPYSSFAGDDLYISLDRLYELGLIRELPGTFMEHTARVDYSRVRAFREPYLREAFENFLEDEDYQVFASQSWVYLYGVFRALKAKNNNLCWNEWPERDKNWPIFREPFDEDIEKEARYHMFLQYMFYIQWKALKTYANDHGIKIMGDIPFYVGIDSLDVWADRKSFLLDENGVPVFIAGVPPDYFSTTGQRWGNPIYDWDYLKEQDYDFWIQRIGYNQKMFDIIRIDHFRAFDTYWKIPATCSTAMEGAWIETPGYEVLDMIFKKIPDVYLVAEDLGMLRPQVHTLKNHYHLKGMKILVFALDPSGKYAKDIEPERENMILYTGTHDNDTIMEWYGKLTPAAKRKIRRFLKAKGIKEGSTAQRLITYVLRSRPDIAVISMPDVLALRKEGHMNTPGTVGSPNWEWHMPAFKKAEKQLFQLKQLIAKNR